MRNSKKQHNLSTFFVQSIDIDPLTVDEKLGIIKTEYSIPVDEKLRKDMSAMCNLSQGIRERTVAERDEKIILNMHREGYTSEQIAKIVERTIGEVEAIIKKRKPILA